MRKLLKPGKTRKIVLIIELTQHSDGDPNWQQNKYTRE